VLCPAVPGGSDHRDLRLLAAVNRGAATYLVTEDRKLRGRAARLGMGGAVLSARDCVDLLSRLHPADATPPPHVDMMRPYLVDLAQPIFQSLRADYPEFDSWFSGTVATDERGRRCWVVRDDDGKYDAIAIVKVEDRHPEDASRVATKIATFKVADHRAGEKVGELLLKTVLEWAHSQSVETLFVEVAPRQESLIRFLERFGFEISDAPIRNNGDKTYLKVLWPRPYDVRGLEYSVRYGPPAIDPEAPAYVVPIVPKWYRGLFPDSPTFGGFGQSPLGGLAEVATPFGNAIRKAYLCHSPTREIPAGSTLLFYRSGDGRGEGYVQALGVSERSMRSEDPERLLSFVGRRTVYSADDVVTLCEGGSKPVLAMLFRHDHFVGEPWSLTELLRGGVLRGAPQSITHVQRVEGITWLRERTNA